MPQGAGHGAGERLPGLVMDCVRISFWIADDSDKNVTSNFRVVAVRCASADERGIRLA